MAAARTSRRGKEKRKITFTQSDKKANSSGNAKRKARSVKAVSRISDVYDFEAPKAKRANVKLALDRVEEQGVGYEESEDEISRDRRRPRLIGEGEEDEQIGSDEDEEIDSDAAFEEEDEIRFAEFDFKSKKKVSGAPSRANQSSKKQSGKGVHFAEVDLNEDNDIGENDEGSGIMSGEMSSEGEEEEGEDDEFIDVLDVLDGRGEPDFGDDNASQAHEQRDMGINENIRQPGIDGELDRDEAHEDESESDGEEIVEEEGNDDDAENDGDIISGDESDELDPSALDKLDKLVSGLGTGTKRKASDEGDVDANAGTDSIHAKKKRLVRDITETGVENEFGAKASASSKLSLDDLLAPLASKKESLSTLKKSLKPLITSSNPKHQPLPAPLPTRTQEKLDRAAAYEQTKQEVDKWNETMKKIQEAEHLSFPLQAEKPFKTSNLELTAKFKPTTELESSIDRLLKSAKLREEDITKTEELMMKDLSVEEVAERRAELRKMRELTFRAEMKAKRVAKIKSKAYRRIQKKAKEKLMAKLDAGADGDLDEDELRMKAEIERARERATLRHKNTGKWAKAMKARNELDEDQRKDITEMLDRSERLRRRIQGQDSGSEDEDEGTSSDGDLGDERGIVRIKNSAFEELQKLQDDDFGGESTVVDDPSGKQKAKSVFQMKFMKDAAARQNREVNKMIDDFTKEMGALPENSDEEVGTNKPVDLSTPVERVNGRMVFRPGPSTQQNGKIMHPPPPPPSAISETSTMKSHDSIVTSPVNVAGAHDRVTLSPPYPKPSERENPWLSLPETPSSKIAKRSNEVILSKDSSHSQKSEMALMKKMARTNGPREKEGDDATLEISTDDVIVVKNVKAITSSKSKKRDKKTKPTVATKGTESDYSDDNSELDEQEAALQNKPKGPRAFEQRELVARAFAGDNVVKQFADAKRKEMESDAPKEVDTTLPGWGSWGGAGTKKAPPKSNLIKKVAGVDPKSRADYGKAHVIISERRDKKAAKFAIKDLPYPYTSKAQYEASMATPLGTEWNTRLGFQRGTLPKVVKKMGTIIEPLEKVL